MGTMREPRWWTEEHRKAWERVKASMRKDWEHHLQHPAANQAAGAGSPAPDTEDWNTVEGILRFGFGAHHQYRIDDWDDRLEAKLRTEWDDLKSGRSWDEARALIRRGWNRAKPQPSGAKPDRH